MPAVSCIAIVQILNHSSYSHCAPCQDLGLDLATGGPPGTNGVGAAAVVPERAAAVNLEDEMYLKKARCVKTSVVCQGISARDLQVVQLRLCI
jgi:hypothetical protein